MTIAAEELWQAVLARDARFDGQMFYGVLSTGVYCRPSCPSRRPKADGVRFFDTVRQAEEAGFRACLRCRPQGIAPVASLVRKVTEYVESHPDSTVTLQDLGTAAGVSPFHLQRTFKKATGITPKAYIRERRAERFGRRLPEASSVTAAIYDAGFGASSRAYEQAGEELGMTPVKRRKRGEGITVRYTIAPTEFGELLVAATGRGVCAVRLGDRSEELETEFRKDFARAELVRDDGELVNVIDQIMVLIGSSTPHPEIPVDVKATAFQRRVWDYLRAIPRGETRSYSQVAADMGMPRSTRAVARACALNEVALIVPCHRVVGANGNLTGFRWGVERKRKLLERERS